MGRVAILGSGMVCAPVVDMLYDEGVSVTLCSIDVEEAEAIAGGRSDIRCMALDVRNDMESLDRVVSGVDAVVSLVPAPFHPAVAKSCIKHKCHLITASYESPSIASLHQDALDADIAISNEVGLDPGLDHMSAMQVIHEIEDLGGKVRSFRSLCGGLPAPEYADNPLRYKFSWNPLGVLTACQNSARFLLHGAAMEVDGNQLLDAVLPVHSDLMPSTPLEQIPNRDSTIYQSAYDLKHASTVYRGTLRYAGFCNIVGQMARVGLLNPDMEVISPKETAWGDYLAQLLQAANGEQARELLFRRVRDTSREGVGQADTTVEAFDYLDLFGDEAMGTGADPTRAIECLCQRLQDKLAYDDGERDAVLLHHEFITEDCGGQLSKRSSSLKCFGDPYPAGPSAMATTVGVPTALSTLAILDGSISRRGVFIPTKRDVYGPLLQRLEQCGIAFTEKEEPVNTL